jgi:hypothetical protein
MINVEVAGQSLPQARAEIVLPNSPSDLYRHFLTVNGRQTNELLLDLDDLPEYLEGTPEATGRHAPPRWRRSKRGRAGNSVQIQFGETLAPNVDGQSPWMDPREASRLAVGQNRTSASLIRTATSVAK